MNHVQVWVILRPKSTFDIAGDLTDDDYDDYLQEMEEKLYLKLEQSKTGLGIAGWRFLQQEEVDFTHFGRADLLIVDDEYATIGDIYRQSQIDKGNNINRVIIVDYASVLAWLLKQKIESPRIITLDFKLLEEDMVTDFQTTQKLYDAIKKRWANSYVIGLTQTEGQSNARILEQKIRSNGESVYGKGSFMNVLSDIFRDRLQIINLRKILADSETKNAVLTKRVEKLEKERPSNSDKPYLVGSSGVMRDIWQQMSIIKGRRDRKIVVIEGAIGTGKSTVAKALRDNMGVRGEYTEYSCVQFDAKSIFGENGKEGLLKKNAKGVIIFNKLDLMPKDIQERLAEVLECGHFCSIGSLESQPCPNLHFIFMTHQSIKQLESANLYAQICNDVIKLPLLKERTQDIEDIVEYYIKEFKTEFPRLSQLRNKEISLTPAAYKCLKLNAFDKNITGLKECLETVFEEANRDNPNPKNIYVDEQHIKATFKGKPNAIHSDDDIAEVKAFLKKIEEDALLAIDRNGLQKENLKQKHLEEVTGIKNYRQKITNFLNLRNQEEIGINILNEDPKIFPTIRYIKPFKNWTYKV